MPSLRVLAVDDEPCVLRSYQRILRSQFDVVTVESGRAALELLMGKQRFDAVLCDVHIGDMTGFDVFDEVRRHSPEQASRFIWVTGSMTDGLIGEVAGGQPYLCKPFTIEQLEAAVTGLP